MAEIEKSEELKTLDGEYTQNHQSSGSENSEKMLKPWLKNVGKEFYMNEELGQYDSLPEAIKALLERPKAKVTPDSYGEEGKVEEAYKKAGLTSEEAKAISEAYKEIAKAKPELKDLFKDRYEDVMNNYKKGVESFADDTVRTQITEAGLDKDPVFVEVMARVGKETADTPFTPPKTETKKNYAAELVRNAYKR